jgi:hypothetical protein
MTVEMTLICDHCGNTLTSDQGLTAEALMGLHGWSWDEDVTEMLCDECVDAVHPHGKLPTVPERHAAIQKHIDKDNEESA